MLLKNAGQDLNGRAAERRGRGVTIVSYLCYPPNALTVAVRRLRTVAAIRVRSHCISLGGLSRMLQSTDIIGRRRGMPRPFRYEHNAPFRTIVFVLNTESHDAQASRGPPGMDPWTFEGVCEEGIRELYWEFMWCNIKRCHCRCVKCEWRFVRRLHG